MNPQQETLLLNLYMEVEFKKRVYEEANDKLDLFIRRNCKNPLLEIRISEKQPPVEEKKQEPQPTNGQVEAK